MAAAFPWRVVSCSPRLAASSFLPVLLAALPLAALAQHHPAVRGRVAGAGGAAIELATITLHRAADSTVVVKTEFSDAEGEFLLEAPAAGRYRLSVAQVGYARHWSAPLELVGAEVSLGTITLKADAATALKDVVVTGRKPLYERSAIGTTVNVADNPTAAGATALDVLGRSPGVSLDAASNISLRGRQGLLVIIDGRRSPLAGEELAAYLRALPAEQLQSLELLTTPPAQYDAQGTAGALVIHLKKDQRLGTNGSVNASYGQGRYGKFVGGGTLNHRGQRYNVYGTYSYADRAYFNDFDFARSFAELPGRPAASSVLATNQRSHLRSHTAKLGLDLNLSKRTLLGASVGGLFAQTDARTDNQTQLFFASGPQSFHSANDLDLTRPSVTANLNLRHVFADSANAAVLSADADVARYHTSRLNDLTTSFDAPGQAGSLLHGDQGNTLIIRAAKVDYSLPLPHRLRLEAGLKSTLVTSDNNVTFRRDGQLDTAISKPFYYRENVNAAYATLRGTLAGTSFRAGLRAEQTNLRAEQGARLLRERNYVQLFPNLVLEKPLNKDNALALTIARRVDRPAYTQLNPLRSYLDATSYSAGNPDLVAATSYAFELSHTYKGKYTVALAYARTNQPILNVTQPAPDGGYLVVNRWDNLDVQHFYTLTVTTPVEIRKWWTMYLNAIVYYNGFEANLVGTPLNRGRLATNLTLNHSFVLPGGWAADLNGIYESGEVFGYQRIRDRGQVSVGIQKSLWQKQGTLRLGVTDIFYTTPITSTSTYDTFSETFRSRQDLRVATLALTYKFGNGKVAAARKRAAGAEDELRRAAGQ